MRQTSLSVNFSFGLNFDMLLIKFFYNIVSQFRSYPQYDIIIIIIIIIKTMDLIIHHNSSWMVELKKIHN